MFGLQQFAFGWCCSNKEDGGAVCFAVAAIVVTDNLSASAPCMVLSVAHVLDWWGWGVGCTICLPSSKFANGMRVQCMHHAGL